jgi:hypothetical protein
LLLLGAAAGVFTASAQVKVTVPDRFSILTGNFGSPGENNARRPENASYAWLEEIFIREAAGSLIYSAVVPIDSYPFKSTLKSFRQDVKEFLDLLGQAKDPVAMFKDLANIYEQVRLGLSLVGTGASEYEQRTYLERENGIKFPDEKNATEYDSMMTTILYAVERYQLGQAIFGISDFTLPAGVWLEEAAVLALKQYFKSDKDYFGNVTTLREFVVTIMKAYLRSQNVIMPDNATEQEIISALVIIGAKQIGYTNVPSPETMIEAQLIAYELGSEIFMRYKVMCQPGALMEAMSSSDPSEAIARIILETMVHEKSNIDPTKLSMDDLFTQTLVFGYFALTPDFYSDVYEYNVQLMYKRDNFYLSAFSYAPLMEPMGLSDNVTLKVNGVEASLRKPINIGLDSNEREQLVDLEVHYRDASKGVDQTQHYVFHVFQGTQSPPANEHNLFSAAIKIFDLTGTIGTFFAQTPKSTGSVDPTIPPGYVPPTFKPNSGILPPLIPDDFGAVLGANTAVPANAKSGALTAGDNAQGLAALLERLKQDNLWLYITGGMVLIAGAVTVFIHDRKKQEAEHLAMGFKPTGKKKKNNKPDNRF